MPDLPHARQLPDHRRRSMVSIRVRYNECDPMGVAHHTVYSVWFELGRTEMLRDWGSGGGLTYRDLEAQGIFLAVVALDIRYKRPARYDDLLTLCTVLTEADKARLTHAYELTRGDTLLATGSTTLVCLDRKGWPQTLPPMLCMSPPSIPANK